MAEFATAFSPKRCNSVVPPFQLLEFRLKSACMRCASSRRMAQTGSFRDLKVWQQAMAPVEEVYRVTARFPREERFGLTAQIRRAAVSIPSNIGEGRRRKRQRVYLHFLDIALGSQGEVEVQLEIALRLGFLAAQDYQHLANRTAEIGRMLNGLIESMQPYDSR